MWGYIARLPHLFLADKHPRPTNKTGGEFVCPNPMTNNTFVSLEEFKALHLVNSISIKRNKETNKLFAVVGTEVCRVQQDIDSNKPVCVLIEEGGDPSSLDNCCLINYDPDKGAETIMTF